MHFFFYSMSKGNITLIGVGRLGICTSLVFEAAGYNVLGVDIFPDYVQKINDKTLDSPEPEVNDYLKASKNFKVTLDMKEGIDFSDLLFICVDTPSTGGDRHYDVTKLSNVLSNINKYKPKNKHIMIMCTVMPGYIREIGRFLIRDCENTTLNYNPEFIAQGAIMWGFLHPDVVLIGAENEEISLKLTEIYKNSTKNTPYMAIMNPESAELMKISLNCFITTKIAYANMIGDIADLTPGADKFKILQAIGMDSRVGSKVIKPGYSYGGPCFPRDNRALLGYAQKIGFDAKISRATDEMNREHINFQFLELLKKDLPIYEFIGISYKEPCNVPIIEESAKILIAEKLARAGKKVLLKDKPHILKVAMNEYGNLFEYEEI